MWDTHIFLVGPRNSKITLLFKETNLKLDGKIIFLVACGEKMGFQITLFLTLAIYTTVFQEELPVFDGYGKTPAIAIQVLTCILSKLIHWSTLTKILLSNIRISYGITRFEILVNAASCLLTAFCLIIYFLGEEQVRMPSTFAYSFVKFMERVMSFLTCNHLDYIVPNFSEVSNKMKNEEIEERFKALKSDYSVFMYSILTLTRPIGLPPHAPVAQKVRISALSSLIRQK